MGRRSKRYVQARRKRMRKLPLSTMTRREVAELMGVSEVTVLRDERAIGRSCRIHTRAEISHLGVLLGKRFDRRRPSRSVSRSRLSSWGAG